MHAEKVAVMKNHAGVLRDDILVSYWGRKGRGCRMITHTTRFHAVIGRFSGAERREAALFLCQKHTQPYMHTHRHTHTHWQII